MAVLPAWVTLPSGASGSGNGNINFTVASNTGLARSGGGTVNGTGVASTFSLNQAAPPCAIWSITPASTSVAHGGASGSLTVTADSSCSWTLSTLPSWVTASNTTGTGYGSVNYTVAANTGWARSAYLNMSGTGPTRSLSLNQAAAPCTAWSISPQSTSFTAAGTTGTLTVTADSSCSWSLNALPSWMTASSNTSGSGNGSISYTVAANIGAARNATATLSGSGPARAVSLNQAAGPCMSWNISPTSNSFAAAGTTGTLTVTADSSCSWSLNALPVWMTASSNTSGTGNGSISYTVAANIGAARSAMPTLSGSGPARAVSLNQAAGPCMSWSITPTLHNFQAAGATGSLTVTADSSCSWSLGALPGWMTASSTTSGAGNASIGYTVAANTGAARSAIATMSGSGPARTLSLNQASGVVVVCSSTPINSGVPVNAMLQTSACTNGARGAGYYTDRYTFPGAPGQAVSMHLTAAGFDTYVYLRNPAGALISSNDDGGGGTNSRIPASSGTFILPEGTSGVYTIEVTSYAQYKTGAYSLSFTQ